MPDDISTLQVRVQSVGVTSTTDQLKGLATQSARTETATTGLIATLTRLAGTYITVTAASRGFMAVIQQVRSFEVLRAAVTTAVGSTEKMEKAWKSLMTFANTTPFEIDESVQAFTRMINFGLAPSTRALKSFGDTAAGMTISLLEMTEAVAKATVGEFTPLEKIGVKAKRDGDQVTFAFRGMTTTVKNSVEEIQKYFVELGEKNFAGSMENRMKTLDGSFSLLSDSWKKFKYDIGTSTGMGETFSGVMRDMAGELDVLAARFQSGEIPAYLTAWGSAFDGMGTDAKEAFNTVGSAASTTIQLLQGLTKDHKKDVDTNMTGGWKGFVDFALTVPASIRFVVADIVAQVEYIGRTLGTVVEEATMDLKGMMEDWGSFAKLASAPSSPVKHLKPAGSTSSLWDSNLDLANTLRGGRANRDAAAYAAQKERRAIQIAEADRKLEEARANAQATWDRVTSGTAENLEEARKLGEGVLPPKGAIVTDDVTQLPPLDVIAEVAPKNPNAGVVTGDPAKGSKGGRKGPSEYEQLLKELQTEEQAISNSLSRRLALIQANTTETSALRAQASLRAIDMYEEEQLQQIEQDKMHADTRAAAFDREEELLKASYERRRQIILSATELTEDQRMKMMGDAQVKYQKELSRLHQEEADVILDNAQSFFKDLTSLSNSNSKTMFRIAQGAAIANATIDMFRAAQRAMAEGGPYGGPIMAAAAFASGAMNIAAIKNQQFTGSYAEGGIIPGASFSGDKLTANVNSGEMVLNKSQQRNLFELANGNGGGGKAPSTIINIQNYGPPVEEKRTRKDDTEIIDIIVGRATGKVAEDINKGGTPIAKAMESTFNLTRGKGANRR